MLTASVKARLMKVGIMKAYVFITILVLASALLCAQGWSTDASSPTIISNGNGEQVIPKIAIDSSGNSYITQFDNANGGYQLWIMQLNANGNHQIDPPTGMPVSTNPMDSWLSDYDMQVDRQDCAIVAFQDLRSVTNNIFVYKVAVPFTQMWGANGISLSGDTSTDYANFSPKILNTSDNSSYVAWMHGGPTSDEVRIQKINPAGEIQWQAGGISIASNQGGCNWPQLVESGNGDILLKYYLDSGPFWAPTRHIYVARINPQGQIVWNNPISTAGGISAWNQIIGFVSDGSGGAVLAWYDDRNNDMINEVYVSHITHLGNVTTETNGSAVTIDTGNQQYNPQITVDAEQQKVYVFFKITDANQNNNALGAQCLSFTGEKLWGDSGLQPETLSLFTIMPHFATISTEGIVCVYEKGRVASSDLSPQLRVRCFTEAGGNAWDQEFKYLASNTDPKLHYSFAAHGTEWFGGVWEQGTSNYDTYAMRMNADGSLGVFYAPPTNLVADVQNTTIHLTWDAPATSMELSRYRIFFNGIELGINPLLATEWTFENWNMGSGGFFVVAQYSDGTISSSSNVVYITIVANSDISIPQLEPAISVYPNPMGQSANITWNTKLDASSQLSIYNLKGQLVERVQLSPHAKSEYLWDASAHTKGIYLISMDTPQGRLLSKVVKL